MSNDVQLTEAEEMRANKIFHQSWNDVEQLNYLPEEDRDSPFRKPYPTNL